MCVLLLGVLWAWSLAGNYFLLNVRFDLRSLQINLDDGRYRVRYISGWTPYPPGYLRFNYNFISGAVLAMPGRPGMIGRIAGWWERSTHRQGPVGRVDLAFPGWLPPLALAAPIVLVEAAAAARARLPAWQAARGGCRAASGRRTLH